MKWIRTRGLMAATLVLSTGLTVLASTATSSAATLSPSTNGCDVLVTAPAGHDCLLPWPNNAFTKTAKTPTGVQLNITSAETPINNKGVHISPTSQDLNDGFSPGSMIMTYVPNLSLANSGIVDSTNIAGSLASNSPIVIVNTKTGAHVPYFAQLDATNSDASSRLLLINPAIALTDGVRYAVVLRNLKDTSNATIAPAASTVAALNGTLKPASRGSYIKNLINVQLHGVLGSTVPYMAWDFTVASTTSITGPAISMRDQAYKTLSKNGAPSFTVTSSTTTNGERTVLGTYQVPLFLKAATITSTMNTNKAGMPLINGKLKWTANFVCVLPSTVSSNGPALPAVYGHGLLGDATEVEDFSFADKEAHNMMGCATDWLGLDQNDVFQAIAALNDLSNFHQVSDQMLQGMLDFQFLGRLINSPSGFVTSPAFQDVSGHALFQVGKCTYVGYSQGAIMGAAVSAVSNEWTHVMLGQGGMDYAGMLLQRSTDWNGVYAGFLNTAYPNKDDVQIGLQLAQLLWDRGEADGYAANLTSNLLPGTVAKKVLLIENYGDHQVPNVADEVFARTIGAAEHAPAFSPQSGQTQGAFNTPYGIGVLNQTKATNAALELWNFGTLTAPTDNSAPAAGGSGSGLDPHDYGRDYPTIDGQIITFLTTNVLPDVCSASACSAIPGR